jgi:nucleoprotein TPR
MDKEIELRLTNDNKTLSRERTHLADLVGNIQRMHDDLDKANERDRQRQETQIQTLEVQK